MDPNILLVCVGVAGLIVCLGAACIHVFDRYGSSVTARLHQESKCDEALHRPTARPCKRAASGNASSSGIRKQLLPNRDEERQRHQSRLVQAGIYSPDALSTFFTVKLGLMLAPPVVGIVVAVSMPFGSFAYSVLLGCIGGVAGMLLPSLWLDRRIRQRHRVLRHAVPDMLDLMTVCLEGGLSLQGTLQRVGDELGTAHPTLAGELAIAQREIDLGVPAHSALRRLADRTGCDAFRRLTTCVRDAQRQGSDLASALRIHSDTMRDQRESEGEEAAQKASVKILIPTLLFIFPAVFVVLAGPAAIRIHESFSQPGGAKVRGSP